MALLEVKDIRKKFGKTEVLKGIGFELERGEVLAVIGSSGSGKTTFLRCLNFLETPDAGTVYVDGQKIFDADDKSKSSEQEIRRNRLHFGLVFQSFNLFPQYNVFDNVTLAPKLRINKDAKKSRMSAQQKKTELEKLYASAHEIIATVGLSDKEKSYPCELSGGQQQRVAIARALVLSPDILCFDEPTSALDPELTGEVLRVIKRLKSSERTMIVVTHEMEFARNVADKVIFMANGVIEEIGTPEQVFDNPVSPKTRAFLGTSLKNF
ncbi:MAG: amino acid ABC transporter ATP-binding protein [Eubacteriales bacterium]